ncbi:MAG: hypothetical protein ACI8ZB_003295 [Desulforhopalus sp.]|jgi:hypothetical protein
MSFRLITDHAAEIDNPIADECDFRCANVVRLIVC